jgi:hypothetical protein
LITVNAPQNVEIAIRPILIAAETEGYNVEDFIRRAAIDVISCQRFSRTADRV